MTDDPLHGLLGEVVEADVYRVKRLRFAPTLVFDLGANCGFFTLFAAALFPWARIVAIEPHPETFMQLCRNTAHLGSRLQLRQEAIGGGAIWHATHAANPSQEVYMSPGMHWSTEEFEQSGQYEPAKVGGTDFVTLLGEATEEDRILMKMDCEGGEQSLLADTVQAETLRRVDCLTAELHWYAATHEKVIATRRVVLHNLWNLTDTHECTFASNVMFHAIHRKHL